MMPKALLLLGEFEAIVLKNTKHEAIFKDRKLKMRILEVRQ